MKLAILLAAGLTFTALSNADAQTELNAQPTAPAQPTTPAVSTPAAPLLSQQPSHYTGSLLSMEVGWGAPYGGLGFSYGHHVLPNLDINAGLGLGVGGKIGVGARYYLRPQSQVSPYLGVNLVRSGRLDNVEVTLDQETAVYSMAPSGVLHLRGGLRWQPGRLGLLGTLGYGVRVTGDPVTYQNGYNPSMELRNLVQTISPGGVEISLGLAINLGH
ncbi:hypothetical protein [Hymenobacter sp. BT730]|uniref:hypothetical protein n=1 Tax=Hymenobacter sp. BT730 TaxID=3063332 RepID=UPI0026DEBB29|nr:hypothetical protein [Hymenobacter sp. BT730]